MCPLHADHELRKVDVSHLNQRGGRKVHLRKPRNAKVIDISQPRGIRNNGLIEVTQNDSSDDSGSEFYDDESPLPEDDSTVLRLPAKGIKLDFIEKIKRYVIGEHNPRNISRLIKFHSERIQLLRNEAAYRRGYLASEARRVPEAPRVLEQANFSRRSFVEQQTALNLAQFANANEDLNLSKDQVTNLVGTLIVRQFFHRSHAVTTWKLTENAAFRPKLPPLLWTR